MKKNAAKDLLEALRATVAPTEVPPGFYTVQQLAKQLGQPITSSAKSWRRSSASAA